MAGGGGGGAILDVVRHGLEGAGKIGEILAREYKANQVARVDERLLDVDRRFEEWKAAYRELNQGREGVNAAADYAAKYAELAREAVKEFDGSGNEIFGNLLKQRLGEHGVHAFRDGAAWQERQRQAWETSQWNSQLSAFERMVAEAPEDEAGIQAEGRALMGSWMARNPGLDPGAIRDEIQERATSARLEALIAQEKYDAAERLLNGRASDWGVAQGVTGQRRETLNGQWRAGRGGPRQISGLSGPDASGIGGRGFNGDWGKAIIKGMPAEVERLIRYHARRIGMPEELALAQAMQESSGNQGCISRAGAIGVMQLMPATARALGVNPHNLEENIRGGFDYMAQMFEQFGNWEDALRAYNGGPGRVGKWKKGQGQLMPETRDYVPMIRRRLKGGGQPAIPQAGNADDPLFQGGLPELSGGRQPARARGNGLSAANAARFQRQIDAARQQSQKRGEYEALNAMIQRNRDPDFAIWQNNVLNELNRIEDPQRRDAMWRAAHSQLEWQKRVIDSDDAITARKRISAMEAQNVNPLQARVDVLSDRSLSPGARDLLIRHLDGQSNRENAVNRQALDDGLLLIDQGQLQTEGLREHYAISHGLTTAQASKLRYYQGNKAKVSILEVQNIFKSFGGGDKLPDGFYDLVLSRLPKGHDPNNAEIQQVIAQLMVKSDAIFSTGYLYDAMLNKETQDWLPQIQDSEVDQLNQLLKQNNLPQTSKNRKLLKKLNLLGDTAGNIKFELE